MPSQADQPPILQFHNVTAYRNSTKVMDKFSMTINHQQHTAIVGPNGAGKSTFLQLLTHQLYPVTSNDDISTIKVFGKDQWNVSKLRKRIGIVSTDLENAILHNLNQGRLTAKEVVLSGFFSSMQLFNHHRIDDEMKRQADKALASINSKYLADRKFSHMSAGEARRTLIARALVTSPDLLVLDEPTTALDIVARKICLQLIRDIAQQGTTVVIITHQIRELIPEIKNVILLQNGQSKFSGTPGEVLTSNKLSKVYDHPLAVKNGANGRYIELNH